MNELANGADQTVADASTPAPTPSDQGFAIAPTPLQFDADVIADGRKRGLPAGLTASPYLTTDEAAVYMRKSVSWLLRLPDLPFLRGKPNLYVKADLDAWVEKHKFRPRLRT